MNAPKLRTRAGKTPSNATGLILDGENGWNIYRLVSRNPQWVNLKLVSREPVRGGANYWMGWNLEKQRLSYCADAGKLEKTHPEVHEWLVDCMTQLYPTLTEADMALPKIALDTGIEGML